MTIVHTLRPKKDGATSTTPSSSNTSPSVHYTSRLQANLINETITQVACGETHILYLTEEGNVYSSGSSNNHGQLGREIENKNPPITQWFKNGVNVKKQYALRVSMQRLRPALVPVGEKKKEKIIQIATGKFNSAVLTDEGKVYVFGQVIFYWM
jgi:alpha-tubulin suppressor-like RCC1 family protein